MHVESGDGVVGVSVGERGVLLFRGRGRTVKNRQNLFHNRTSLTILLYIRYTVGSAAIHM